MASESNAGISLVEEEESPLNSTINTTPLVDVMLVMLIIFMITIPVAISNIPLKLPTERNQIVQTRKENINLFVDADGNVYWNTKRVSEDELASRLAQRAPEQPQPEVHIRGDLGTEYYHVGKVVEAAQKAGILKIGFITKAPEPGHDY
ncbi:MAG TPA: biopolymer transporter ExbD [Hyphomonadaceae bacterium]|nr:biopolymer transporter ExbD [Hyphomonadaceae bacterium]